MPIHPPLGDITRLMSFQCGRVRTYLGLMEVSSLLLLKKILCYGAGRRGVVARNSYSSSFF